MQDDAPIVDKARLLQLERIGELKAEAFLELAGKLHVESQPAGRRLFVRGHRDQWCYYLLEGEIRLDFIDGHSERIHGASPSARHPLANQQPRQANAITQTEVRFIRIDANLLEVLSQDVSEESYQLEEFTADDESVRNRLFYALYSDYMAEKLSLPQLPNVALKVKQIADDPDGDLRSVAHAIQASPVLPSLLINIANSAYYQLRDQVTDILGAVSVLGMRKTRDLVITHTLRHLFRTDSRLIAARMQRLWRHSALTGAIGYAIARLTPGLDPDRTLLLGLIHDIGILPVIHYAGSYPELANNPAMLDEAVHALRSQIGAMVLRQWGFADEGVAVCLDAENWYRDPGVQPDYTDAVLIAQRLADALLDHQPAMPSINELPAFNKLARGTLSEEEVLDNLLCEAQEEIAVVFQLH